MAKAYNLECSPEEILLGFGAPAIEYEFSLTAFRPLGKAAKSQEGRGTDSDVGESYLCSSLLGQSAAEEHTLRKAPCLLLILS